MAGVLSSIAVAAKNAGKNVMHGMRGDIKSFTKDYGKRVLKSNMTESQLKELGVSSLKNLSNLEQKKVIRKVAESDIKAALGKDAGEKLITKMTGTSLKSHQVLAGKQGVDKATLKMFGGKWGEGIEDKMIGRQLAKNSLTYRIGDNLGGGIRDTVRSKKAGHTIKQSLTAGFTRQVDGQTQVRMGRVAGTALAAGAVGRVATGGGLYRDRYGRVNVPGIPFI